MNVMSDSIKTAETAPSTSTSTAAGVDAKQGLETITKSLVDLGATWARLGLSIGRSALQTSAKSLTTTAEMLGQIADALESKSDSSTPSPTR
jgi:hypothetical protein